MTGRVYVGVCSLFGIMFLKYSPGRRACEVHSCWLGKGPSRIKDYYHAYVDYATVHRIKVDEKRGFIITTHGHHDSASQGRVMVSDISDGQPIWGLDSVRLWLAEGLDLIFSFQAPCSPICSLRVRGGIFDFRPFRGCERSLAPSQCQS